MLSQKRFILDESLRRAPRTEPAVPSHRLCGPTDTVHNVLYSYPIIHGLTLRSTVEQVCWTLRIAHGLPAGRGTTTIGDMVANLPHNGMSHVNELLGHYATYEMLRDLACGAAHLSRVGVVTLDQWSKWIGFREDLTTFTRGVLEKATQEAGLPPPTMRSVDPRDMLSGSSGEAIVQSKIAMPLVESIHRRLCWLLAEDPYLDSTIKINMKDRVEWLTTRGASKPQLMLVSSEMGHMYHILCCEVKAADSPDRDKALAQAVSCGAFLTPATCYSVIVVGVCGSKVEMGLATMLTPPVNQHGAYEWNFPNVRSQLPPLPVSLFGGTGIWNIYRKPAVWGVGFDYLDVQRNCPDLLTQYIDILCKPIACGMRWSKGVLYTPLGNHNNAGYHVLQCSSIPTELQFKGSSDNIIVKCMCMKDPDALNEFQMELESPFLGTSKCALSRKIEDVPVEELLSLTVVVEGSSSGDAKEEIHQVDKYEGYAQLFCVYNFIEGTTTSLNALNSLGQAVLLCMTAAVHDDMAVAHCNIRTEHIVWRPARTSGQCTLKLIGWSHFVERYEDENARPDPVALQDFIRFLGPNALQKLKKPKKRDGNDKKWAYYRLLDLYCVLRVIRCYDVLPELKRLADSKRHQPSRDVVRHLVANCMMSCVEFTPVARRINRYRLVGKTLEQLEAVEFPEKICKELPA